MYSFRDFLAATAAEHESELQNLNAKKRLRGVGMWEDHNSKKNTTEVNSGGDPIDPNAGEKRMIVGDKMSQENGKL